MQIFTQKTVRRSGPFVYYLQVSSLELHYLYFVLHRNHCPGMQDLLCHFRRQSDLQHAFHAVIHPVHQIEFDSSILQQNDLFRFQIQLKVFLLLRLGPV